MLVYFFIFTEIPDFLSKEECDLIIKAAMNKKLFASPLFADDSFKELESKIESNPDKTRTSQQTWLDIKSFDKEFYVSLQHR